MSAEQAASQTISRISPMLHQLRIQETISVAAYAAVKLLAVIGFCAVWAAWSHFLPWSGMSVNADSIVTPPTFLLPG